VARKSEGAPSRGPLFLVRRLRSLRQIEAQESPIGRWGVVLRTPLRRALDLATRGEALGRGGDEPRQAYCRPPQAAPSRGVGSSLPRGAAGGVPQGEAGDVSLPTFVECLRRTVKVAHGVTYFMHKNISLYRKIYLVKTKYFKKFWKNKNKIYSFFFFGSFDRLTFFTSPCGERDFGKFNSYERNHCDEVWRGER
jgi:hypothetical protein